MKFVPDTRSRWLLATVASLVTVLLSGTSPATWPRVDVQSRMRSAIDASLGFKVVKEDILGEGAGRWDPDPRYPEGVVNCIIWIQYLIAEVFGETPKEKLAAMDAVRYFGSNVGWGTRIHYVDHWTGLEPGPLRVVPEDVCVLGSEAQIELDVDHFKRSHDFPCPIARESIESFTIRFLDRPAALECSTRLAEGFYLAFAVAKREYVDRHGASSGPMGLVHGLVVHAQGAVPRREDSVHVFHASTQREKIASDKFSSYIESMKGLHKGYVLYELDPHWTPSLRTPNTEEEAVLECEANLRQTSPTGGTRSAAPVD